MFEQTEKQAIIVHRANESEYAHLLTNFISEFTEYEVAEWEEKEWNANKATTSSSQKVIFLGGSKAAQERYHGMDWKHNRFNMKYGWLGNQCVVVAASLTGNEIQDFGEYYKRKAAEYEAITENPSFRLPEGDFPEEQHEIAAEAEVVESVSPSEKKRLEQVRTGVLKLYSIPKNKIVELSLSAKSAVNNPRILKKLLRHQYDLVICRFVFSGDLKAFMEG